MHYFCLQLLFSDFTRKS